jgi:hypothetical protein
MDARMHVAINPCELSQNGEHLKGQVDEILRVIGQHGRNNIDGRTE